MAKFAVWSWNEQGVLETGQAEAETPVEAIQKSGLSKDAEDLRAIPTMSPTAQFVAILGNRWRDGKKVETMIGWVIWDTNIAKRS